MKKRFTGTPFFSFALRAAYPATILFRSAFELATGLSNSSGWPKRGLAAGTLHIIGRIPKSSSMLATRKSFPA